MKISTFVKKAMGKIDSTAFLQEHRDWLCNFKSVLPVMAMLENKIIFPTPALQQILQLIITEEDPFLVKEKQSNSVFSESINPETGEVTNALIVKATSSKRGRQKEPKKYQLFLFRKDDYGINCQETFEADSYQEAWRMSNRILFRYEDSVYMEIMGMGVATSIGRTEAVGEILRRIPGPVMKKQAKTSSTLRWIGSAKQDVVKFSRG